MALKKEQKKQLTLAGVLFGLAIMFFFLFNRAAPEPMEFFYDESEEVLFEAPAGSIPPIRGINDNVVDGVRAIVIAPKGKSRDASARRIAYLEKWSSQLKQQLEAAAKAKKQATPCQTSSIVPREISTGLCAPSTRPSGTP